jgi:hypothetical protein
VRLAAAVTAIVLVVNGDETAIAKVFGAAFGTLALLTNVLVSPPHVITRNLAVVSVLVFAANPDTAAKAKRVAPPVALGVDGSRVGSVDAAPALHVVDCLIAVLDLHCGAERFALAVVVRARFWRRWRGGGLVGI